MKTKKLLNLGIFISFLFSMQMAFAKPTDVVATEKLDSITYLNGEGTIEKMEKMTYTEEGLLASHITYNSIGDATTTLTYTYNELGQLTEKVTVAPLMPPFTGVSESKEEYTYDANGVLNQTTLLSAWGELIRTSTVTNDKGLLELQEEKYSMDEGESWELNDRKVYSYDDEDRLISVQISAMGFEDVTDVEAYTYTEEDGKTIRIGAGGPYPGLEPDETPVDGSWKDKQITDENGDVVSYEKLTYSTTWDFMTWTSTSSWAGEKYTVTKMGNTVTTNKYIWDSENEEWSLNASTEDMPITSMWNPTAPPTARWITEYVKNPDYDEEDPASGEPLIGSKRTIYSLSNGIVSGKSESRLTSIGGSIGWSLTEEELYTVDESVTLDQIFAPATLADAPYFFTHKPLSVAKHTFTSDGHITDRVTYSYSPLEGEQPSIISNANAASMNVYFAKDMLTVDTAVAENINVYTTTGALVFSAQKAEGKAVFDIAQLSSGLYVVKGADWATKIMK